MNYFAHFFIDHIVHNTEYNVGLILPDLARGFVSSFRKPLSIQTDNFEIDLWKGCQKHYETDKRFHASTFFNELIELAKHMMDNAEFKDGIKRRFFLEHIMAELMIDRILVKKNSHFLHSFYDTLNNIYTKLLLKFLHNYKIESVDKFEEHFNHFRKVKYIYYYTDNIKFVYSLNRVMLKAGLNAISESNQYALIEVIENYERKILKNYGNIDAYLK